MTTTPDTEPLGPYEATVLAEFPRRHDLTARVSRVEVDGVIYLDIREWVPSINQWGRGILLPARIAKSVGATLTEETADVDDA
ncbi:hypothetical protein [Terracoccus sp. 273MFTsu3.1]|uniref:hypothetical protein n=1 Tax=Terracoccus sp. 273MFTsu3.1 TaxID=1172188 RepID=UPI0003708424|nr:hypothetical protein [Terracoccus sp. 273MFTsu3.1]